MDEGIYHNEGRFFDDDELERLGLRLVKDSVNGEPLIVRGLVNTKRTISVPGPWVVPFVRNKYGGEKIIADYEALSALAEMEVDAADLSAVLVRLAEEGRIGLRLAAAFDFKGAGRFGFWPNANAPEWLKRLSGKNVYVPGLANSSYGAETWQTYSAIGALRETVESQIVLQNELLDRGAVFSGVEVAAYKLFDKKMLPEIEDGLDYREVWMTQRFSYTTCRASMFLDEGRSERVPDLHQETLLPWLKKYYGEGPAEKVKEKYLERVYAVWGCNLRAALPLRAYRTGESRLSHNWGPHLELIDLG
ncbi:MAG: hypothetical protein KAR32_10320, partial [Candidatus Omnitrophica bacterium]|nr:hypothetical protein [Candidatus Omnitrophota bacterium]